MLTSLETNCNVIEVASAIQIKHMKKKLTRLERESSINAHKIAISIQNFIKENSVETYRLDTVIKANPKSKERLQENVALLKEFTSNLEAMLNGRIVIN